MQTDNFIQYSNTDLAGNPLTHDKPIQWNGHLKQSNCLRFGGSDYVYVGPNNCLDPDVTKVEFYYKENTANNTAERVIISNPFNTDKWKRNDIRAYSNGMLIYFNGKSYTAASTTASHNLRNGQIHKVVIAIEDNAIAAYVDDLKVTFTIATYLNATTNHVRFGARTLISSDTSLAYYLAASIWDFRFYNSNDELVHHYPMAEGRGLMIYDVIGGKHGVLQSANVTTSWSLKQDVYHYNAENGFTKLELDNFNDFSENLYIPIKPTEDGILIAKDRFESGYTDYQILHSIGGAVTIKTNESERYLNYSVSNAVLGVYYSYGIAIRFLSNFNETLSGPSGTSSAYKNWFIYLKEPSLNHYVIKIKIRVNAYKVNGITKNTLPRNFWVNNYCQAEQTTAATKTQIPVDGQWHEYKVDLDQYRSGYYTGFADTDYMHAFLTISDYNSGLTTTDTVTLDYDIKGVEVYRKNGIKWHEPANNNHNGCESLITFSKNQTFVPEDIYSTTLVQTNSGWNPKTSIWISKDQTLGASGHFRLKGWEGLMAENDTKTGKTTLTNGYYNCSYIPRGMASATGTTTGVFYIDNYTLSTEDYTKIGITKNNNYYKEAIAISCYTYFEASGGGGTSAGSCLNFSAGIIGTDYNIWGTTYSRNTNRHFYITLDMWVKNISTNSKVTTLDLIVGNSYLPTHVKNIATRDWEHINIKIPFTSRGPINGTGIGIGVLTRGVNLTLAELRAEPFVAIANCKIKLEPMEGYIDSEQSSLLLYDTRVKSNSNLKRIDNKLKFKL